MLGKGEKTLPQIDDGVTVPHHRARSERTTVDQHADQCGTCFRGREGVRQPELSGRKGDGLAVASLILVRLLA